MRNFARLLAFDLAVPLATIAGLLAIGVMLDWPLWWVSACSGLPLVLAPSAPFVLSFMLTGGPPIRS